MSGDPHTPSNARLKVGVREAIELNGGIDGAAATAKRQRSVTGDWNNLSHAAFPAIDKAKALDQVALAQGRRAPILTALAAELGAVVIFLPDASTGGGDDLASSLMETVAEAGDVADRLRRADIDRVRELGELEGIDRETTELLAAAGRMQSIVRREIDKLRVRGSA